ncbi:MAG: hypothetical protein ABI779_26905 [Acidobacteriota bacterium]
MSIFPFPKPRPATPDQVDGLPVFSLPPTLTHIGRYVDSHATQNFQGGTGISTIRARSIRVFPDKDRVVVQMGNAAAVYLLNTLRADLAVGMKVVVASRDASPKESYLQWNGFLYPENKASQWFAPAIDDQDPMGKGLAFDRDDRGNLYGVWSFGWGIALDGSHTSGTHLPKVVQMTNCGGLTTGEVCPAATISPTKFPNTRHDGSGLSSRQSIMVLRVGNKYFVVVASGSAKGHAVFDVTDPAAPRFVQASTGAERSVLRYDRHDATSRVAFVDATGGLRVYSYNDLVLARQPSPTVPGSFADVAFDESGSLWAVEKSRIVRFAWSSSVATRTDFPTLNDGFLKVFAISAAGGHVAIAGETRTTFDVRIAKVVGDQLQPINTEGFFANYYHGGAGPGFAKPALTFPFDVQLIPHNGKLLLMYSATSLGDVYEVAAEPVVIVDPTKPPVDLAALRADCTRAANDVIAAIDQNTDIPQHPAFKAFVAALERLKAAMRP